MVVTYYSLEESNPVQFLLINFRRQKKIFFHSCHFTCFSGKFNNSQSGSVCQQLLAYSLSTTIDCLDDLNLFLASGRADTDNFQYSDADFRNNLNDNYVY